MGRQPRCSVIIPTYNRAGLLRLTLQLLTRQDLGTVDFEVLVVDDGSTDDTAEVVARFEDSLNVRYFYQPDKGFRVAAARNVGIANAAGDICVFIDSGVLAHSGCLRAHVESHQADEPVAAVGYVYCFNDNNQDAVEMVRTLDFTDPDGAIEWLSRERKWLDPRETFYGRYRKPLHELPAPWVIYWTCNASASTRQLREIGGFDEEFRSWGAEDTDLAYRLHRAGARFVLAREAGALHHPHEKSTAVKNLTLYDNYRRIIRKFPTPITRLLVDPDVDCDDINEVIVERGLPACVDYLERTGAPLTVADGATG